jgi:large subunit ribosomal protein L32
MNLELQLFAVPFRKVSKTRGRKRRTHYKISANTTTTCSKCGSVVKPHRVCKECGTYKGKEIIKKEDAA